MPLARATILTVTIASGTSLSGAVEIGEGVLIGIVLPTMTSASLSFQASADGTTYGEAVDSALAAIAVSASTGGQYIAAPAALNGVPFLKIRSGTSGAPVNQGADRVITLIVK